MATLPPEDSVRTRILILSDTHGMTFLPELRPHQRVDLAIHCGDLTEESKIAEFRTALKLLQDIDAPLKLVIAGNHDFTLDVPTFKKKIAEASQPLTPEEVREAYGDFGEARKIFDDARKDGILFLDEGTHHLTLENGASVTVYARPYTPSLSDWGFQYPPGEPNRFSIERDTDIVMTHGPPKGIMDFTSERQRAGCPGLFAAIARTRPVLHCYGHIHEGWGAKMVTWRETTSGEPSHLLDIDNGKSVVIENLSGLRRSKFDDDEAALAKAAKARSKAEERCYQTSHCLGDEHYLQRGKQTLFVNAAIEGDDEQSIQLPWLVDIELPRAQSRSDTKAVPDTSAVATCLKRKRSSSSSSSGGQHEPETGTSVKSKKVEETRC